MDMDTTRDVDRPPRILGQVMGATLVLLLATIVFTMAISGSFRNYLQEWLGPWLLASAIAMGALSLWTLLDATDKIASLKRTRVSEIRGAPASTRPAVRALGSCIAGGECSQQHRDETQVLLVRPD